MRTRLIISAPTCGEARLIAESLYPAVSGAPSHIRAGATLLSWAVYEEIDSCPACSSPVGSDHLRRCSDHYASIADDGLGQAPDWLMHAPDASSLQNCISSCEGSAERLVAIMTCSDALAFQPPPPWLVLTRPDLAREHLPPPPGGSDPSDIAQMDSASSERL